MKFVDHSGDDSVSESVVRLCGCVLSFRQTKPLTFADCIGDELPVGWEEAYDPVVGAYYVDHNTSEFVRTAHLFVPLSLFNLLFSIFTLYHYCPVSFVFPSCRSNVCF